MATLSEILKSKIGKGGKSKAYVADILGVSEKTIENYMNGIRQPKPEALVKLAETLGFSLSELSEQTAERKAWVVDRLRGFVGGFVETALTRPFKRMCQRSGHGDGDEQ